MTRLIVSDFDGTLMPYGQSVLSDSVKQLLRTALDRSIAVAVSSGRTYGEMKMLLGEFAREIYFICCDGAYYIKDDRVLYERQIARTDLEIFASQAGDGLSVVFHGAKQNYALGDVPHEADRFRAVPIARLGQIKEKIFKVTSYGREVKLPAYCGLRMHWDGGPNASAQYVNRFADKGSALSDLQMRLMLTKFDTAAMGDSGNDIAMMHNAKLAIAVGDRCEDLRRVCHLHLPSAEAALESILT